MADAILISLSRRGADRVAVQCDDGGRIVQTEHALPDAQVVADLLFQIRGESPAAGRALAEILGAVLFSAEPGNRARAAWQAAPNLLICLEAEGELAEWPWELALDPVSGRCPVVEGLAMVRIGGPDAEPEQVPADGIIVSPTRDHARADALDALTRSLGRKGNLRITRAAPASPDSVRDLLHRGAALLHLDSPAQDGRVVLDAEAAAVSDLGIDASCWLGVIGGHESGARAAQAMRAAGAQVVIARQMALDPQHSAALDRKLYQCLAKGLSPIEAIRLARAALMKRDPTGSAWAAPVLWSVQHGARVPAAVPFPPKAYMGKAKPKATELPVKAPEPAPAAAPAPASTRRGPRQPINALRFIGDTIGALQLGVSPDDPDLATRLNILRALRPDITAPPPADLDPAQQVDWMADALLDGLDTPAAPLATPDNLDSRAAQLALLAGARADETRLLAQTLIASPVVALRGDGAERLAHALAEDLFDAHLSEVTARADAPLMGGPGLAQRGEGDGWLYSMATLNWRIDEDWEPDADAPPPQMRLPVILRDGASWQIRARAWLGVRHAARLDDATLDAVLNALDDGVLAGFDADGHRYQLDLPPDFRLILLDVDSARLPDWVPVLDLTAPVHRAAAWLDAVQASEGAPTTDADRADRTRVAGLLDLILGLYSAITQAPSTRMGEAALRFAVRHGGDPHAALDAALCTLLAPRLQGAARATVYAWLAGDPDGMVNAADAEVTRGLARYLDAVDPAPVPRVTALGQLGPMAFVTESSLAAPDVALPGLLAALAR